MNRDDYTKILEDNSSDVTPLMFYYFNTRAKKELQYDVFILAFQVWITQMIDVRVYSYIMNKVLTDLTQEFYGKK